MKREVKQIGGFFRQCIAYLTAALLGTVVMLVVFFPDIYGRKKFLLPNWSLALIALGVWLLFAVACRFVSEKHRKRCSLRAECERQNDECCRLDCAIKWMCVGLFLAELYIAFNIYFSIGWDPGSVWWAALTSIDGEPWGEAYFSMYPNNLLLLLIETTLARFQYAFGFLTEDYAPMACIAVGCVAITLSCYFTYRVLCLVTRRRYAVAGFCLCVILAGLSPWFSVYYSDSYGILFPILTVYLYSKPRKTERGKLWGKTAAIAVGCIGYYMKPQCIIPVIGILCVELIQLLMQKSVHRGGTLVALIATALLIFKLTGCLLTWWYESQGLSLDPEAAFGPAHFLMMGLNEATCGVFSEADVAFSGSFATVKERNRADLLAATDRLRNMGPGGYLHFVAKKLVADYYDGTFAWGGEGEFYKKLRELPNRWMAPRLRELFYSTGSKYCYLALTEQMAWIAVLLLAGVFTLFSIKRRKDPAVDVMKLTALGAILFMILFETRARYAFLNVPIFCALAAQGMAALEEFFASKKKTEKAF